MWRKKVKQEVTELEINGTKYIRADSVGQKEPSGDLKIVVLQRGWILVGFLSRDGSDCSLSKASVIRVWGTTKGLGELAKGGPTDSTKLDPCHGLVEFDRLTMVLSLSCDEKAWKSAL